MIWAADEIVSCRYCESCLKSVFRLAPDSNEMKRTHATDVSFMLVLSSLLSFTCSIHAWWLHGLCRAPGSGFSYALWKHVLFIERKNFRIICG